MNLGNTSPDESHIVISKDPNRIGIAAAGISFTLDAVDMDSLSHILKGAGLDVFDP